MRPRSFARLFILLPLVLGAAALACGETAAIGGAGAASGPRVGADDADLWNLVPVDADAIADVDLAALRASPWTSALLTGGFAGDREERIAHFGYDIFADADRMVVAGGETAGASRMLTVARGRFDPDRIGAAFAGVTRGSWRDSPLWQEGTRAVALVTPRTVAQGGPDDVRAAIDAAWGIVPDARGGRLADLRRQLQADRNVPAAFIAAAITDSVRARAVDVIELPDGLQRAAARLDVGADLDAQAVALMTNARAASDAAALWTSLVRSYARQPMVALLGLTPVLQGTQIAAAGSRVQARLHIPAAEREQLAEKLLALLKILAATRR
jgi:hypothetical protein